MYFYFYKITNTLNNHYYYGVHKTENLDDGYMGSGHRLHIAYKKYGIENFKKEILKFFDSMEDAYEYEAEVVNESLILLSECYNIQTGGQYFNTKNMIVVKKKNDPGYYWISKDEYDLNKDLYKTTWTGRSHTEEEKEKVRKKLTPENSKNPRIWISKDGVTKYLKKELLEDYLKDGWSLGRIKYTPRKNCQGKIIQRDT